MRYIIAAVEDYCPFDDGRWKLEIEAIDALSAFTTAAQRAFDDWGWECRWQDNPPDFVAVDEDGRLWKATIRVEIRPEFLPELLEGEKPS